MKTPEGAQMLAKAFSNPAALATYAENARRMVPGLDALHRMTGILLAEVAPAHGKVLVLGAGGGMELDVLSAAHPAWTFVGVDPAAAMLELAKTTVGPRMDRVELIEGTIDAAPPGPFDAAVCLLTLHFLAAPERTKTLRAVHDRLRAGAPFVTAHGSFPQETAAERDLWFDRYAAYAVASGVEPAKAKAARDGVAANVSMIWPAQDEEILREAGFHDITQFFAAFTFRGWVSRA